MLSLISEQLSTSTQAFLTNLQNLINQKPDFLSKVEEAQRLWKNKEGSKAAKVAFGEIRETLKRMCVGTEICNYCENNEATDIEHILPKSFFPEDAFVWENYLLACKTCNTGYKLDKIAVFLPEASSTRHDIARKTIPPNRDVLMLNPRIESPLDFIDLNLKTGIFQEIHPDGTRECQRANYTFEAVLQLNTREALRQAREAVFKDRFQQLSIAVAISEAASFDELNALLNATEPYIDLDQAMGLEELKVHLLKNIQSSMLKRPHPTVWEEMKRQHEYFPRLKNLFDRYPESLAW